MVSLSESDTRDRRFLCAFQMLVGVHVFVQCLDMQHSMQQDNIPMQS